MAETSSFNRSCITVEQRNERVFRILSLIRKIDIKTGIEGTHSSEIKEKYRIVCKEDLNWI